MAGPHGLWKGSETVSIEHDVAELVNNPVAVEELLGRYENLQRELNQANAALASLRDEVEMWKQRSSHNLDRLEEAKAQLVFISAFADPPDMKTGKTSRAELEAELVTTKERLRYQDEWLSNGVYFTSEEYRAFCEERRSELAAARAMNGKLREYARHKQGCRLLNSNGQSLFQCTCGLEELIK